MAGDRVGLAITVARWFKGCVPLCTKSGVRGLWVAANVSEKSQSTSRDGVHGISSGVDPVSPTISQRRSTWRSRGSDDEALASAVTASMPKRLNSASRSASSARNAITSACSARATTASCRACSFSSNLKFSESSADADASPAARSTPSSKALEWPHGLVASQHHVQQGLSSVGDVGRTVLPAEPGIHTAPGHARAARRGWALHQWRSVLSLRRLQVACLLLHLIVSFSSELDKSAHLLGDGVELVDHFDWRLLQAALGVVLLLDFLLELGLLAFAFEPAAIVPTDPRGFVVAKGARMPDTAAKRAGPEADLQDDFFGEAAASPLGWDGVVLDDTGETRFFGLAADGILPRCLNRGGLSCFSMDARSS
eukprot:CAMPEP_0117468686 /NCGR_PEP_ID=MMETSP0784-20121206/6305_1 /TAXON_ID=39447 /ORGANISM="" /LENGTH=367 /DNA_ID=CAMNT_0005262705 /DNA_START=640 /DNA_END=1743 /DNA_ORIENTATION=-